MDDKFNLVWEQCIGYIKNDIQKWQTNTDEEMIEFYQTILKNMQNEYQRVKKVP